MFKQKSFSIWVFLGIGLEDADDDESGDGRGGDDDDQNQKQRLEKRLQFHSSHSRTVKTTLAGYVRRMHAEQPPAIFYAVTTAAASGGRRAELDRSPFVARLLAKGYEVLYLTKAVDEYAIQVRFCLFVKN